MIKENELLLKLGDIVGILDKHKVAEYLLEALACKALLAQGHYAEFWKRISTTTWWGRDETPPDVPMSMADLFFSPVEDMVVFEKAMLFVARALEKEGIQSKDAREWVYMWEDWYDPLPPPHEDPTG
jgi:hypothetical protein